MPLPHWVLAVALPALVAPAAQEPPVPVEEPLESSPVMEPGAAEAALEVGLKAFARGRFQTSQAEFKKAVDADPSSAAAHFYYGYATYKVAERKRPFHPEKQQAAQHFAKAYELDPAFIPVWAKKK